ncbi:MAG: peptidoglycan-binding domain-containing protein [Candidatus Electrothrix sp. YB6]
MKKMKNGTVIGAAALFALTGCVTEVAYVPQDSGSQDCVQDPCDQPVQQKVAPVYQQAPAGQAPAAKAPVYQQAPVGQAPATQAPVYQQAPVGQAPVGQAPVGQAPVDQDLGEGLPMNVQPGECFSRCIAPAVYDEIEEQIEVKPASEKVEVIPAEYEWAEEQVLIQEASEEIRTIPPKYEWQDEEVVIKEASEDVKVIPAKYEWRDEEVIIKEASEELKVVPAVYAWREGQVMVSPEVINVTITDPGFTEVKEQVLVQAPSAKWIKKAVHCTPEDLEMGLTDCDTLCYVEVPALYKTVIKKVPDGTGGERHEVVIPAEYKTVRTKVVVEPARTEVLPIPPETRMIRKQVMVEPARTEVVPIPPETRTVRKNVLVEPARSEVVPIPPEYKTVRVKKLVKPAEERVVTVPPEYKTVTKKVKVSDSKIVWRPAVCEDEATGSKVQQVQQALMQQGFYSGEINGMLDQETNEAIRTYQMDKGLPMGGGLTLETLDSLGIY